LATDLQPLGKLQAIEMLNLSGTGVVGISPLGGLTKLRELNIASTSISDSRLSARQAGFLLELRRNSPLCALECANPFNGNLNAANHA
jgi:Leucine-rich repeat (LRR) protein